MSVINQIDTLYNSIFQEFPDVVSVEDVAKMLGIGRNKAYELVHCKAIKSIRVGRKIKVPKINVIEFLLNPYQKFEMSNVDVI